MRKIYAYINDEESPVLDFFGRAGEKTLEKLKFQLSLIKDESNVFKEPYIRHISIAKYSMLYELRFKAAGVMVRVIFYEFNGEVILLYAFYKKDKRDTKRALEISSKILDLIIDENGSISEIYKKEMV